MTKEARAAARTATSGRATALRHPAADARPAEDTGASAQLRTAAKRSEQRPADGTQLLLDASALLAMGRGTDETLAGLARLTNEHLRVGWCDLYTYDQSSDELVLAAHHHAARFTPAVGASVGERRDARPWRELAAADECAMLIERRRDRDLPAERRAEMAARRELAGISAALVYRGRFVGAIHLGEHRRGRDFGDGTPRLLTAVAQLAAVAIVTERALTRVARESYVDDLTGVFNHRYLRERLRQTIATARRYGQELSLLLVDVDDFEALAEAAGRRVADEVLALIARLLLNGTRRDVDIVTRLCDDQFVVLLPQTTANGGEPTAARYVGERLCAAIAEARVPDPSRDGGSGATVSIGIAGLGLGGVSASELLASAGKALYVAKRDGKNRVHVFGM